MNLLFFGMIKFVKQLNSLKSDSLCPMCIFFINNVSKFHIPSLIQIQEYLADPVRVKVGKVSSPTENVIQILLKVSESEKVFI